MNMLLKFAKSIKEGNVKSKIAIIYKQNDNYYVYLSGARTYNKKKNRFLKNLGYANSMVIKTIADEDKNAIIIASDVIKNLKETFEDAEDIQDCLENLYKYHTDYDIALEYNLLKETEFNALISNNEIKAEIETEEETKPIQQQSSTNTCVIHIKDEISDRYNQIPTKIFKGMNGEIHINNADYDVIDAEMWKNSIRKRIFTVRNLLNKSDVSGIYGAIYRCMDKKYNKNVDDFVSKYLEVHTNIEHYNVQAITAISVNLEMRKMFEDVLTEIEKIAEEFKAKRLEINKEFYLAL